MTDPLTAEDLVSALAEDFLDRHRRGLKPSVESYAVDHPELAEEIRRLFPALVMMEELKPASGDATGSFDGAAVLVRGARLERLGDYRILREVGRGGMDIVYEAEQESLGRRVALKILAVPALQDTAQVRRFEREARAAAKLHHTNIVPVFGVGVEERLHYYVMQFIQGLGLDDVIAELKRLRRVAPGAAEVLPGGLPGGPDVAPTAAGLARSLLTEQFAPVPPLPDNSSATQTLPSDSPDEPASCPPPRVTTDPSSQVVLGQAGLSSVSTPGACYGRSVARLGLQVARALDYAHTQGILHRDVKPSNLLLDIQGTAWVADFGLAKAVEGQVLTHTGDIVGTIRYMAPERFKGRCDARADVYALGLTLYEMLALRPAFEQTTRQALIRQVMEEEPPRLRKLNPAVPRDLETVVHKAIEKDPAGRYPSASAVAEDLALFLEGKPVRARAVGVLERCGKWARRRPAIAALLAGLVFAVLTGLTAVTWQWRATVAARDEARRTLKMANDAVDTYFTQVSEEHLLEEPGMQPLRERLLALSLPYYQKFAEQASHDPTFQVQLANAYLRWGALSGRLTGRSTDESKRLLRTAVSHFERLLDAQPRNLDVRIGLARSLQELAYQEAFGDAFRQGARTAHRAAEVWAGVVRERPDDPLPIQMVARSHDIAGVGLAMSGDLAGAKAEFQEAIAVLTVTGQRFPNSSELRSTLAQALNNLGETLKLVGDLTGAAQMNSQAHEMLAALVAERPMSTRLRKELAATLEQLGRDRTYLGLLHLAESNLVRGRGIIDAVVRENPKVIEYRRIQGETNVYLGLVWAEQGHTARARAILEQNIDLERELHNYATLGESLAFLAGVERETGQFSRSANLCEEARGTMKLLPQENEGDKEYIRLLVALESARLAARTGESCSSRETALRTLLREWEEKSLVNRLSRGNRRLAVDGYLALAEIAERSGSATQILEELDKAEAVLAGELSTTKDQARWRSFQARIDTVRGFALARAGKGNQATAAANRAVTIEEPLTREDPSYNYDLACAYALQARLDPSAVGPPRAALKALEEAIKEGFDNAYKLKTDDRLVPLRPREDFRTLIRLVEEKTATPAVRSEAANTGP